MTCERVEAAIPAWLTGDLDEATRLELQAHVAECASCARALDEHRAVWEDLGVVAAPRPSPAARERLAEAVRAARAEVSRGGPAAVVPAGSGRRPRLLWNAAASVVLFGAGVLAATLWPTGSPPERGVGGAGGITTYLVLMRGDSEQPTAGALDTWLADLRDDGRIVGGAQLDESDGAWFGPPPEPFAVDGLFEAFGYMIIEAADAEAARAIARSSPHIGPGGAVEIWPVR